MDREQTIIAHLDALNSNMDSLKSHMDSKFESIDRRFAGIDQRLDGMDQRFDSIEVRLEKIEKRLDKLEEDVHQNRILLEDTQSDVKAIAEGQSLLSSRLDQVVLDLKLERQYDRAETRSAIRSLRERIDRLEATG